MKVLVIGFGSIGRRHAENLLRRRDVREVSVQTRRPESLSAVRGLRPAQPGARPDAVFICSETARHAQDAMPYARRGVPLFIEKPLAHHSSAAARLIRAARRGGAPVFVAYNLRFLGALQRLKAIIAGKKLGKLCAARIEAGQWLPDWRPGRDWRAGYSADAARGGGAALDLSHELDYMRWLFGQPKSWRTEKARVSGLTRGAEDVFEGLYRYAGGFLCSVHLDLLQRPARRRIHITGTKGSVEVDLIAKKFTVTRGGGQPVVRRDPALFDVSKTYAAELDYFLRALKARREPVPGPFDGQKVLELAGV